ncbi:MAG: PIN domain-containing protein [Actinomycetota bacterium]
MYCLDTDVLSVLSKRAPPPPLIRRLGAIHPEEQCTTAINVAELLYGVSRSGHEGLEQRVRHAISRAGPVFPFDLRAAEVYGSLRARLESEGRRLDEPDLRIASIAIARDLTLVTGNIKHFSRVSELDLENWLTDE